MDNCRLRRDDVISRTKVRVIVIVVDGEVAHSIEYSFDFVSDEVGDAKNVGTSSWLEFRSVA